jgi:DNA adenine methylase
MTDNIFPYSGGKSRLAEWITSNFPQHRLYCEPFGGSASVLVNKDRSKMEIYNDIDGRVVNFFRVFRDRTDELVEWLERTPYSRQLHDDIADRYFEQGDGEMPEDDVARAGMFFYLRYSQLMAKNGGKSGFQSTVRRNNAVTFRNATDDLQRLTERFHDVVIENRDYQRIFEHYDDEDALFYCDPPYLTKGTNWYEGEFDHGEFWEAVEDLDGYVAISYMEIPGFVPIEKFNVLERRFAQNQNAAHGEDMKDTDHVERLILNYDPEEEPRHTIPHDSATDW